MGGGTKNEYELLHYWSSLGFGMIFLLAIWALFGPYLGQIIGDRSILMYENDAHWAGSLNASSSSGAHLG